MATYGYVRVSKLPENTPAGESLSLDAQQRDIQRYADWKQMPIAGVYADSDVSGTIAFVDRPRGSELFKSLRNGDHIIVSKLDRAFRSTKDCLNTVSWFRDRGITFHFLDLNIDTSTPAGEFMLTVMAAAAQMERNRISQRIREAMAEKRARGEALGNPYYGWKYGRGGRFVRHPEKQFLMQVVEQKIIEGMNDMQIERWFLYIHYCWQCKYVSQSRDPCPTCKRDVKHCGQRQTVRRKTDGPSMFLNLIKRVRNKYHIKLKEAMNAKSEVRDQQQP